MYSISLGGMCCWDLKSLAYTRPHSVAFCYPIVDKILNPYPRLHSLDQFPCKLYPVLDQNSSISIPYHRANCLKTPPFTVAHTYLAYIWECPPPPPGEIWWPDILVPRATRFHAPLRVALVAAKNSNFFIG